MAAAFINIDLLNITNAEVSDSVAVVKALLQEKYPKAEVLVDLDDQQYDNEDEEESDEDCAPDSVSSN